MRKNIFLFGVLLFMIEVANSQSYGFFTNGYLLYNKDTIHCRIWFNPDTPYFKKEIIVWLNEESKNISLENNNQLTGFGITQSDYKMNLGKIRLQGLASWNYVYAKKLVTGKVELFELPITSLKKDPESYGLVRDNLVAYFIGTSGNDTYSYPVFLKSLKKKKISPFLDGYPELVRISDKEMTPSELVELLVRYNNWYTNKESK
ncbi:MAG TPA: hypothetical protein VN451_10815 [Chitinophagaceae bacterium]|nr:hypothetical protein [Chitinophagaceae bacterium]